MNILQGIKKFFIFLFIAALLGGGFLTTFSPTGIAQAIDNPTDYFSGCLFQLKFPNQGDVVYKSFSFSSDMKTITFNITYKGLPKTYNFQLESSQRDSGSGNYYADYLNTTYTKSKIQIIQSPDSSININFFTNEGTSEDFGLFLASLSSAFQGTCSAAGLFGGNIQNPIIDFHGTSAPSITIPPWTAGGRPELLFQLTHTQKTGGLATNNQDIFVFTYKGTDSKYQNLALRILTDGGDQIVRCVDPSNYTSCNDELAKVYFENTTSKNSLWLFYNHVFNPKGTGDAYCDASNLTKFIKADTDPTKDTKLANWPVGETPNSKCVNVDLDGWLKKWGITFTEGSLTNPTGAIGEGTCGLPLIKITTAEYWIAKALCGILGMIADLSEMLINGLFKTVFNAYHPPNNLKLSSIDLKLSFLTSGFSISTAHAATDAADNEISPLNQAFTNSPSNKWGWVIPVWKFVLGLTDLFLVVILLFLGVVNILHIQYDTYAIKKMLPLLIIGVILANFSLVIMRMLIDASNVLTTSFMGGDNPGNAVHSLILNFGLSKSQLPSFAIGWKTVGGLFLSLFFSIFVIAAFLILGVMFYIRYATIILLGIAAPLAFICLAFPPTQSVFKQWWSWTTKFIFMKPIAMFFIMIAIKIKESGGGASLTGWIIITALVYMAIIIPWKLGGAVMSMWGGAMGSIFGTKKGGWARKPVDDWWQRRKDLTGASVKARFPGLFKGAEKDRQMVEVMKKTADSRVKQRANAGNNKLAQTRAIADSEERNAQLLQALQQYGVASGNYRPEFGLKQIRSRRGFKKAMDLQSEISSSTALLQQAQKAISKNEGEAIFTMLGQQMEDANRTGDILKSNEFSILNDYEIDEKTNRIRKKPGQQTNYDKLRKMSDQLILMIDKEQDGGVRNGLINDKNQIDKEIVDFEQNYRTRTGYTGKDLNFAAYQNRNFLGRELALLRPAVGEEAQTIMLNTDRAGFTKQFFGWYYDENGKKQFKDEIGGSGNIRNFGSKDMAEFVNQRYGNLDPLRRAANTFLMVGLKQAMLTNTVDAQEKMCDFVEGMTGDNYLGVDFLKKYLREIDTERGGTLKDFVEEYNERADKVGIPKIDADLNNTDSMLDAIDIGVIRSIDPRGGPGTRAQSLLNNRIKAKIANDGRFLGGRNEALAIGDYSMPGQTIHPPTGSAGPEPNPQPYSPDPNQAMAQYLTHADPEQIQNMRSQYRSSTDMAQRIFQPGTNYNPANIVNAMYAGLSQKLTQGIQGIDIGSGITAPLIDALANLDIDANLNHDELEAQLKSINPDIQVKLDRNVPVSEYIQEAKEVRTGQENLNTILDEAEVEQINPYAEAMVNRSPERLEQLLDQLNGTIERFTAASEQAADKIEVGEKDVKIDPQAMKEMADAIKEARGGDIPLNVDNYRDDPANLTDMANTLKKAMISALNYKKGTEQTPDQFKIAVKKGVQEANGQSTTPPPGTPTPPTPPATPPPTPPPPSAPAAPTSTEEQPYGEDRPESIP